MCERGTRLHTTKGLQHWTKSAFKRLGWMTLALGDGHVAHAQAYLDELQHLREALYAKMGAVHDPDTMEDLAIAYNDVSTLQSVAQHLYSEASLWGALEAATAMEAELSPSSV